MIEVADTGTGIAPEDLPMVFDRFWRAERSRNRQTGGSGLGLAIVRQLVEAHGGTATVRSTPAPGRCSPSGCPPSTLDQLLISWSVGQSDPFRAGFADAAGGVTGCRHRVSAAKWSVPSTVSRASFSWLSVPGVVVKMSSDWPWSGSSRSWQ